MIMMKNTDYLFGSKSATHDVFIDISSDEISEEPTLGYLAPSGYTWSGI